MQPSIVATHQTSCKGYELKSVLGQGAYGVVFKAVKQATAQKVAIKFIAFKHNNVKLLLSAARELRILSSFSKMTDNVYTIRMLDSFLPAGADTEDLESIKGVYIVMDYYAHTLQDVVLKS